MATPLVQTNPLTGIFSTPRLGKGHDLEFSPIHAERSSNPAQLHKSSAGETKITTTNQSWESMTYVSHLFAPGIVLQTHNTQHTMLLGTCRAASKTVWCQCVSVLCVECLCCVCVTCIHFCLFNAFVLHKIWTSVTKRAKCSSIMMSDWCQSRSSSSGRHDNSVKPNMWTLMCCCVYIRNVQTCESVPPAFQRNTTQGSKASEMFWTWGQQNLIHNQVINFIVLILNYNSVTSDPHQISRWKMKTLQQN